MAVQNPINYWGLNATDPLSWPPDGLPPAKDFERKCRSIPIVGQLLAYRMEQHRLRQIAGRFRAQVRQRPPTDPKAWGDDPKRQQFAAFLADVIRDAGGWPNDHFIPSDPFSILCWEHNTGMEYILVQLAVEEKIGREIQSEQFYRISNMSFGEAVDFLRAFIVTG